MPSEAAKTAKMQDFPSTSRRSSGSWKEEVRRSGADPGAVSGDPGERRAARAEAERLWPVSADRSLRLRPGVRGGLGTPVKAVLRKLMRWYVEPLAYDQRSFNAAALRLVDDLQEQVDRLQAEVERLRSSAPRARERRPGSAEPVERERFYRRVVGELLERGVLTRDLSLVVVGGGELDRSVLASHGFENVTLTNLDPAQGEVEDAEALSYADGRFDFGIVSAALHHCRSPHRALLELYRVSRIGVLALEARDSTLMRLANRLGVAEEYELTVVAAEGFRTGGVANSAVPNYVYRWTEREVEKTIRSAAPEREHGFLWFRELELPLSVLEATGEERLALRPLAAPRTRDRPSRPGQPCSRSPFSRAASSPGCARRASPIPRRSAAASARADPADGADRMLRCPVTEPEMRCLQGFPSW